MAVIVFIGASYNWVPTLLRDLLSVFPEELEVRFVDIDLRAAEHCRSWGESANRVYGRKDRYAAATDRRSALAGADAVLITISTGGFDAMEKDLSIPEKYGIRATVGDTCGPAGWSRAIRNYPVFRTLAEDFVRIVPDALIVNYSNPMSALTSILQRSGVKASIGLCHAYFETKDIIQGIFGLPDWNGIDLEIAGVNHFTWASSIRIHGEDAYPLLREKTGSGSLEAILPGSTADELGFISGHKLCAALYDRYGCLPYPADRHTCEFLSFAVCGNPDSRMDDSGALPFEILEPYSIKRTTIAHRKEYRNRSIRRFESIFNSEPQEKIPRSRETGADMIRAFLGGKEITDAVNAVNRGQVPQLPAGACVETLGTVRRGEIVPLVSGALPDAVAELIRPSALTQLWLVEGLMRRDRGKVMDALLNDPQCRGLRPEDAVRLGEELLAALPDAPETAFLRA